MLNVSEAQTKEQFGLGLSVGALAIGILAAILAAIIVSEPLLTFGLGVALALMTLCFWRPSLALKIALLFGGVPLERLGESSLSPGEKPLLRNLGGVTVDGLALVSLCFALTVVLLKSRPVQIPKHFRLWLVFLGLLASSLIYSTAPLDGLRLILSVAYPVLIFLTTLRFIQTSEGAESATRYWIAGGIVATASGAMVFILRGPEAFVRYGDFRYSSGLIYDVGFSVYMFSLFILCYAIWRSEGKRGYGALALLFGFQAIAAQARIVWIAVLVGLLVLEGTIGKGTRRALRITCMAGVAGLIGLYAVWNFPQVQHRMFAGEFDQRISASGAISQLNLSARDLAWAAVFGDYLAHNHWLGQGAGSNRTVLRSNFPLDVTAPHNEYLRVLHDVGIIGLLLFLMGIVGLFFLVRSLFRRKANARQMLFARISLALLVGYVILAVTDNPLGYYLFYSQYLFFAMARGILAARGSGLDWIQA